MRRAVVDLMDAAPVRVDDSGVEPHPARLETEVKKLAWVRDARVRMRDEGHVFFGEVFVVPADDERLTERLEEAREELRRLDWRLHDLVLMPVRELDDREET